MKMAMRDSVTRTRRQGGFILVGILVALSALAGGHLLMMRGGAPRPPASAFGTGPRTSAAGMYMATLASAQPLRTRTMQTIAVTVIDPFGYAVDGAHITVDGGMPQHGHGLPTRPRVTRQTGRGTYEIDGVRFNMGGWWEFKLSITTAAGTDVVTFNLNL